MDAGKMEQEVKVLPGTFHSESRISVDIADDNLPQTLLLQKGHERTKQKKCNITKVCVRCSCLVLAACVVGFIVYKNNEIQNKIEAETERLHSLEHREQTPQPYAFKSSNIEPYISEQGAVGDQEMGRPSSTKDPQVYTYPKNPADNEPIGSEYRPEEDSRQHVFHIGFHQDDLTQNCIDSQMKDSFPDIDYAFLGYDIFRGYPLADGHDPGFTVPIFDADYSSGKQTADCRYSVPEGFLVVPDVSCVTSFSSSVIQSASEFSRSLDVNAYASGGGFGVSFSASAGYMSAMSELKSKRSVYIISTAHCYSYISKFLRESPPAFSKIFIDKILKLDNSTDNKDYFAFFEMFGTHFAKEITFGSRFSYEYKMTSEKFKANSKNVAGVAAQASYSSFFSVSGGFGMSYEQRQEASEFSKSVETRSVSIGAAPPADGDAMTWASTVHDYPVPSKYKLEPLETLFTEEYMGEFGVDFQKISTNMKTLKIEYYNRLVAKERGTDIEQNSNRWITKMLVVDNGGESGEWSGPQFCPVGRFAVGVDIQKVQSRGANGDGIVFNEIKLRCADKFGKNVVNRTSSQTHSQRSGENETVTCHRQGNPVLFLQKFALKVSKANGPGNVSVSAIRFTCRDIDWSRHSHVGSSKAEIISTWSEKCPPKSAVCGIQTLHAVRRRGDHVDNQGAVGDVRLFCCGDDSAFLTENVIISS